MPPSPRTNRKEGGSIIPGGGPCIPPPWRGAGAIATPGGELMNTIAREAPAPPAVAVCIVTHNSAADLPGCLAAVAVLEHRPLELVVVDCASRDGSLAVARAAAPSGIPFTEVALTENRGFAGGMNEALART